MSGLHSHFYPNLSAADDGHCNVGFVLTPLCFGSSIHTLAGLGDQAVYCTSAEKDIKEFLAVASPEGHAVERLSPGERPSD